MSLYQISGWWFQFSLFDVGLLVPESDLSRTCSGPELPNHDPSTIGSSDRRIGIVAHQVTEPSNVRIRPEPSARWYPLASLPSPAGLSLYHPLSSRFTDRNER